MEPFAMFLVVGVPMLLWAVAAVVVGWVAGRRGQNALLWFLIAIVATPLLAGLLLLAVTRPSEPRAPA